MLSLCRVWLIGLVGASSALLFAASALAQTNLANAYAALGFDPGAPGNAVVVHLSDPHMLLGPDVWITNLEPRLVSMINGMVPPPDKVMVSGDVSTTYSTVPGSMPNGDWYITYGSNEMRLWLSAARAITNIAPTNLLWVPGNHDQIWTETNADLFQAIFTNMPVHQRFDLAGVRFLLMNGGNYGDPTPAERDWVKAQLADTLPTQQVAVVVHQPPFPLTVGLPVALREWFRDWQAPWWILCGHAHVQDMAVYDIGQSNVAQLVCGSASTKTFSGNTDNPGCRILCLSNGIVGSIYYHMRSGTFQVEPEPDWHHPNSYVAAFEQIPGLLWRRLITQKRLGPELIVSNAVNSVEWLVYPSELQWALPLGQHGNQATHFLLLSALLNSQVTVAFSTDRTNWIPVPLPQKTNSVYSFAIPDAVARSATGYARFLGTNTIDNTIFGWGLRTTNGKPGIRFPQLARTPNQAVAFGQVLTVTNVAIDPYAPPDELRFSLLNAPPGVVLDPITGVLSWNLTNAPSLGDVPISIKVADTGTPEMSATTTFRVTVVSSDSQPIVPSNSPPAMNISDQTLGLGMTLSLVVPAYDPDYDPLTFQLSPDAPPYARIEPFSGLLEWTPAESDVGVHTFAIIATDDAQPPLSTTQMVTVTVLGRNHAPALAPTPNQALLAGSTLVLTNWATDPDGDGVLFLLGPASPAQAFLDPVTGVFQWTPTAADLGTQRITIAVMDSGMPPLTVTQQFLVSVLAEPPRLSPVTTADGKPQWSVSGEAGLAYQIQASTNLSDWTTLVRTNALQMPVRLADLDAGAAPLKFFRVQAGVQPWDPDAVEFFERVGMTNHSTFAQERAALNQLVLAFKAADLWNSKDAIYPFVGASAGACAQNLRSSAYTITFASSGLSYSNGVTSDGSGWGDTGLKLSAAEHYRRDSGSLFVYIGSQDPLASQGMGCFIGAAEFGAATRRASLERNGNAFSVAGLNASDIWNWVSAYGDFRGPAFASRVTSTLQYHGNFALVVTNNSVVSTDPPNTTCALFGRKYDTRNVDHGIACNLRGASIGAGMTPADFLREAALWDKFNAALNRKAPARTRLPVRSPDL